MALAGYRQSEAHVRKRAKARPVSESWLRERYLVQRASCVDIGRELQRDPKTIWAWLRHYGIPVRPRGHDTSHLPRGRAPGFTLSEEHKAALREARLADGRAPYLKDGVHWLHTVAPSSHPNWKGGHTPERQSFYVSPEWKAAVVVVWKRDDAKCRRCGLDCRDIPTNERRATFCIHHVVSFSNRVLRAEPSNLVLLCRPCHLFVHSKKNIAREHLALENP